MKDFQELNSYLELEYIEQNIYRGKTYRTPWKRVYGGQVLAQALVAAMETVPEDRIAHSLHGYFILTGDIEAPIIYDVDRIRDGGSFTTRRIRAIQHGQDIFISAASFQKRQPGLMHQGDMPDVPAPEEVQTDAQQAEVFKDTLPGLYRTLTIERPVEFRPVESYLEIFSGGEKAKRHIWMKAKGSMPDPLWLHQAALAYASDYNLLITATLPHITKIQLPKLQMASLDHAMWFHHAFRMDEWLLYALESPSASNSRGFTRGSIYNREGQLVASVVQEGLMRVRNDG